jgi:hypothetical protein
VRAVQQGRPVPLPFPGPPPPATPPPAAPAPAPPIGPPVPYGGSQFTAQSGAVGLGGPANQPPPARVNPDGAGGTNPALAYPPWTPPAPGSGWTAPPGEVPRRRATRRPLWIALALLLALILAAVATVLMSGGGGKDESAGPAAAVSTYSRHWNTGVSMGSMTTRVR